LQLRPASNQDSDAVTKMISDVYDEYGEQLFLEGADADLLDIESSYAGRGGACVVLHDGALPYSEYEFRLELKPDSADSPCKPA